MKVAGGGFEQCYNAQAVVDSETMLVMAPHVTQAANDKQEVEPMVAKHRSLPEGLNHPEQFLVDSGYFSENHVKTCNATGIELLITVGRDATIRTDASVLRSRHHCQAGQSRQADEARAQDQGESCGLRTQEVDG